MWKETADKNRLIASLIKQNIDWRTLDMRLIKQIPDEKQNQIKREQERKMKEQEELDRKEKELKIKQEKEKLLTDENLLLQRCLNKDLSEEELRNIVLGDSAAKWIEEDDQGARRWSSTIITYVKILDRYFRIIWECSLTENQDNTFDYQPEEVEFT